jgi:hypothetical protein
MESAMAMWDVGPFSDRVSPWSSNEPTPTPQIFILAEIIHLMSPVDDI